MTKELKRAVGAHAPRRPEVVKLAHALLRKNPQWTWDRALVEAKTRVTSPHVVTERHSRRIIARSDQL